MHTPTLSPRASFSPIVESSARHSRSLPPPPHKLRVIASHFGLLLQAFIAYSALRSVVDAPEFRSNSRGRSPTPAHYHCLPRDTPLPTSYSETERNLLNARMPKTNRHAEVKPSKYKTSLCQFYVKGEACPFSGHCAFAHGEVELQFEESNVAILKATGLDRLDGKDGARSCSPPCPSSQSLTSEDSAANLAFPTQSSYACDEVRMPAAAAAARCTRRQPVMVSLPKYNTASESTSSPYDGFYDDMHYAQFSYVHSHAIPPTSTHYSSGDGAGDRHKYHSQQDGTNQPSKCHCDFSATCRREQVYRHNPYSVAHCGYDGH